MIQSLPSKRRIRRMNRRQHKKLRLGESRGLLFGGGFSPQGGDGIVARAGRSSTSEADRDALVEWLRKHPDVQAVEADQFVDGWYD